MTLGFPLKPMENYNNIQLGYQLDNGGIAIFQSNRKILTGSVIIGIFDTMSYVFIAVSTLTFGMVFLLLRRTPQKWVMALTYLTMMFYGSALKQPLPSEVELARTFSQRALTATALIGNTFITSMYASIVISLLARRGNVEKVDSLQDLSKYPQKKLYMPIFDSSNNYAGSKSIIEEQPEYESFANQIVYLQASEFNSR
jgi:hypothetical protein